MCILPDVMLIVATQVTEVHVGVTPAELAEDEVKEEEKQRLFDFIPNFFVKYEPHPVPLSAKLKFATTHRVNGEARGLFFQPRLSGSARRLSPTSFKSFSSPRSRRIF